MSSYIPESVKKTYNNQYESWVPWAEDKYLQWFGQNKASYMTKDQLDKTKITGIEGVDKLQDGISSTVSGQLGKGGLLNPIGEASSKEVFTRSERQGKGDTIFDKEMEKNKPK